MSDSEYRIVYGGRYGGDKSSQYAFWPYDLVGKDHFAQALGERKGRPHIEKAYKGRAGLEHREIIDGLLTNHVYDGTILWEWEQITEKSYLVRISLPDYLSFNSIPRTQRNIAEEPDMLKLQASSNRRNDLPYFELPAQHVDNEGRIACFTLEAIIEDGKVVTAGGASKANVRLPNQSQQTNSAAADSFEAIFPNPQENILQILQDVFLSYLRLSVEKQPTDFIEILYSGYTPNFSETARLDVMLIMSILEELLHRYNNNYPLHFHHINQLTQAYMPYFTRERERSKSQARPGDGSAASNDLDPRFTNTLKVLDRTSFADPVFRSELAASFLNEIIFGLNARNFIDTYYPKGHITSLAKDILEYIVNRSGKIARDNAMEFPTPYRNWRRASGELDNKRILEVLDILEFEVKLAEGTIYFAQIGAIGKWKISSPLVSSWESADAARTTAANHIVFNHRPRLIGIARHRAGNIQNLQKMDEVLNIFDMQQKPENRLEAISNVYKILNKLVANYGDTSNWTYDPEELSALERLTAIRKLDFTLYGENFHVLRYVDLSSQNVVLAIGKADTSDEARAMARAKVLQSKALRKLLASQESYSPTQEEIIQLSNYFLLGVDTSTKFHFMSPELIDVYRQDYGNLIGREVNLSELKDMSTTKKAKAFVREVWRQVMHQYSEEIKNQTLPALRTESINIPGGVHPYGAEICQTVLTFPSGRRIYSDVFAGGTYDRINPADLANYNLLQKFMKYLEAEQAYIHNWTT